MPDKGGVADSLSRIRMAPVSRPHGALGAGLPSHLALGAGLPTPPPRGPVVVLCRNCLAPANPRLHSWHGALSTSPQLRHADFAWSMARRIGPSKYGAGFARRGVYMRRTDISRRDFLGQSVAAGAG